MRKITFIFLLIFILPPKILASSAKSVVETKVEGENVEVYQSVETTVDGETIKKESREPGRLELEMKKEGEGRSTVIFNQERNFKFSITPSPFPKFIHKFKEREIFFFPKGIIKFFQKFLADLTKRRK